MNIHNTIFAATLGKSGLKIQIKIDSKERWWMELRREREKNWLRQYI